MYSYNPILQGSRSSIRAESTEVGTTFLHHLSSLSKSNKASSFSPPNFAVASEHFAMDVDDRASSTSDPSTG